MNKKIPFIAVLFLIIISCKKKEDEPTDCNCFPEESLNTFYDTTNLYLDYEDSLVVNSNDYRILDVFLNGEKINLGGIETITLDNCVSDIEVNENIFDVNYGDILEVQLIFRCGTCKPGYPKSFGYAFCGGGGTHVSNFGINNANFNLMFMLPSQRNSRRDKDKLKVYLESYCHSKLEKGIQILPIGYGYPYIRYNYLGTPDETCF